MSIYFKARGSSSFGLLLIRLIIGTTFLLAGANKVMNIEAFINHVKSFDVFSQNASFILGFILPFVEIIFGAFYIIGILSLIHISEPTRRTPISYAVFCLKKKKK